MDIAQNIKAIRDRKGLSQASVADLLQMERTNYHRLEKRGNKMTIEQLQSIADALEVSVVELIGGEQPIDTLLLDRVKELEKEAVYLKKILEAKELEEELVNNMINQLINLFTQAAYVELDIGQCEFTEIATGKKTVLRGSRALHIEELPNHKEIQEGLNSGTYEEEISFSDEEEKVLMSRIIQNDSGILHLLNSLGLIKNKEFSDQIKKEGRGFPLYSSRFLYL